MKCCSVRGHYRPNRTPSTKRGVVAHVRTARQSRDCLRVRPSRAPPLFVAVRSACGAGTAHRCTGALAALRRIPAPRGPLRPLRGSLRSGNLIASRQAHPTVSLGVSLLIRLHLYGLWFRAEYRPSPYPRTSAASAQPRLSQRFWPRADASRPPALFVDPNLCENRRKLIACTDCVQHLPVRHCLALSQLFAQSESSRPSLHIRRALRGSKAR